MKNKQNGVSIISIYSSSSRSSDEETDEDGLVSYYFNNGCIYKEMHKECLWFSFADLLQANFNELMKNWNTHHTRRSRHDTIQGRPMPNSLFFLLGLHKGSLQRDEDSDFQDCLLYT